MEHYASEQEQVEAVKRWWKENGKALVLGLVIGIGGLAGYRYWNELETSRAENASLTYERFLAMIEAQRSEDAVTTGEAIMSAYPDSAYARLSALLLAKLAVEQADYERAKTLLVPLAENADSEVRDVAAMRLARILLAEGDAAAAATRLDSVPATDGREPYPELRGDILAARGDDDAARSFYREALVRAGELGLERGAIQLKLDNLAATAEAPADTQTAAQADES
ncbi:MAG: tetratricopeptide repeat protein [Gammaproteobacteria bacterium]